MVGVDVPPDQATVMVSNDGRTRCSWAAKADSDLVAYHDNEWGIATRDVRRMFEALALTYFESGLSWATVFRKRQALRHAFHHFEPAAVAGLTARDTDRLVADRSIIRHRGKIEATIHNAQLIVAGASLPDIAWSHAPPRRRFVESWPDTQSSSPESHRLAAELRQRGYRYVGPVVSHAFMLAVGIENGHFAACYAATGKCRDRAVSIERSAIAR
jgi:DNA-3-methyladenine glycosylase I